MYKPNTDPFMSSIAAPSTGSGYYTAGPYSHLPAEQPRYTAPTPQPYQSGAASSQSYSSTPYQPSGAPAASSQPSVFSGSYGRPAPTPYQPPRSAAYAPGQQQEHYRNDMREPLPLAYEPFGSKIELNETQSRIFVDAVGILLALDRALQEHDLEPVIRTVRHLCQNAIQPFDFGPLLSKRSMQDEHGFPVGEREILSFLVHSVPEPEAGASSHAKEQRFQKEKACLGYRVAFVLRSLMQQLRSLRFIFDARADHARRGSPHAVPEDRAGLLDDSTSVYSKTLETTVMQNLHMCVQWLAYSLFSENSIPVLEEDKDLVEMMRERYLTKGLILTPKDMVRFQVNLLTRNQYFLDTIPKPRPLPD